MEALCGGRSLAGLGASGPALKSIRPAPAACKVANTAHRLQPEPRGVHACPSERVEVAQVAVSPGRNGRDGEKVGGKEGKRRQKRRSRAQTSQPSKLRPAPCNLFPPPARVHRVTVGAWNFFLPRAAHPGSGLLLTNESCRKRLECSRALLCVVQTRCVRVIAKHRPVGFLARSWSKIGKESPILLL